MWRYLAHLLKCCCKDRMLDNIQWWEESSLGMWLNGDKCVYALLSIIILEREKVNRLIETIQHFNGGGGGGLIKTVWKLWSMWVFSKFLGSKLIWAKRQYQYRSIPNPWKIKPIKMTADKLHMLLYVNDCKWLCQGVRWSMWERHRFLMFSCTPTNSNTNHKWKH